MSWTGAKGSREADPSDIEIEEGIGPVVEMAVDMPGGETRGSQWRDDEEEEVTFEADPCGQDASQGQEETERQPHFAPAAGEKTTGPETTDCSDDDEQSSQGDRKSVV